MPMKIYDYKCTSCSSVQERIVKNQDDEVKCKECGGSMKRLVSAPGMVQTNFANTTGFKTRKNVSGDTMQNETNQYGRDPHFDGDGDGLGALRGVFFCGVIWLVVGCIYAIC